jgi:hypothetical protein
VLEPGSENETEIDYEVVDRNNMLVFERHWISTTRLREDEARGRTQSMVDSFRRWRRGYGWRGRQNWLFTPHEPINSQNAVH